MNNLIILGLGNPQSLLTGGLGRGISAPLPKNAVGSIPRFEVPAGAIDGLNRSFRVLYPYVEGSAAVYLNGNLLPKGDWDNSFIELNPDLGIVQLNEAPVDGDDVQIFYLDRTLAPTFVEVSKLVGKIREADSVLGSIQASLPMRATIGGIGSINGKVSAPSSMSGTVRSSTDIRGVVIQCDGGN